MGKILDDPKAYFDSMSSDDFEALLNKYGFKYEDVSKQCYDVRTIKKYVQSVKIGLLSNNNLPLHGKSIQKISKSISYIMGNSKIDKSIINKLSNNVSMYNPSDKIKKSNNKYKSIDQDFLAA
ncbi:hypothetical protein FDF26_12815 [Clostridium botulinum]|nr:hypothetical protein [Clostridium botulinum]